MITNLKEAVHKFCGKPKCSKCDKDYDDRYYKTLDGQIAAIYVCYTCDLELHPIRDFSQSIKSVISYEKR